MNAGGGITKSNPAKFEISDAPAVNELYLVSSDLNHNSATSIVDLTQTEVENNLVKILAWYDNEWGLFESYVR
jgi:glyceraldehyde 3-phosphate dehydrogenase